MQPLNGTWNYRIGKGPATEIAVPFSTLAVGHSECERTFDLEKSGERILLQFEGITYAATVFLNGERLGEMGPYCRYTFDVTAIVKPQGNCLRVELEDLSPKFGPSEGWENFGGIIRDVSLLYKPKNCIRDVFFHATLQNGYRDALVTVETEGAVSVNLWEGETLFAGWHQDAPTETLVQNIKLWSPDHPHLYRLEVRNDEDVYTCRVGFREFTCDAHRFLLNGEPLFLKGVCKHEMVADSGHCPTEAQMRRDLEMIKEAGCNFVRLVHYPHNLRILELCDELGLMVSEEPGLWWSDTSDPEIAAGSLEVLRRTILRDRNHPAIVFWLCFNECRFTEQFLQDSAAACRRYDPTRLVSGANCMSNEDTLKYYNLCGFDFYTMHPYAPTTERAKTSAELLCDKPLLFTEWGGYYITDNPKLMGNFLDDFYRLYEQNRLAGAFYWEWSELNDYNRGAPACIDGNLAEGLVDKYRNPRPVLEAFCQGLARMGKKAEHPFWYEGETVTAPNLCPALGDAAAQTAAIVAADQATRKMRKRKLSHGPLLQKAGTLLNVPAVLTDGGSFSVDCRTKTLTLYGGVSMIKGYPLGGDYGETAATLTLFFEDGTTETRPLRNGMEVTTVFLLHGSSRIRPVAENAVKAAEFGYDKNFEQYILNKIQLFVEKTIIKMTVSSADRGYALLFYGITE